MPFLVVTVEGALRSADRGLEEAAATLGASRLHRVPPGHPAADRPVAAGRCGAVLGPGAGGVRRHHHLRRQLPGHHPDHAARGLHGHWRPTRRPAIALSLVLLAGRGGGAGGAARPLAASAGCRVRPVPTRRAAACASTGAVRRGELRRSTVAFAVAPGEVLGVLGPNGAGKTTLLRALAGLHAARPAAGSTLAGLVLDDPAPACSCPPRSAGRAVCSRTTGCSRTCRARQRRLPARARGRRPVAARPRPRQLAGPARADRARRPQARPAVRRAGPAGGAGPGAGGRAGGCCCSTSRWPRWTPRTRVEVRAELRRHLREFAGPALLVTHDPLEAMVLADRLLVIEDGRVVQQGTPGRGGPAPATHYVARLVGLNLYAGRSTRRPARVALDGGGERAASGPAPAARPPGAGAASALRPSRDHRAHRASGARQPPQCVARLGRRPGAARRPGPGPGRRAARRLVDITPAAVAELDLAPGSRGLAVGQGHRDRGLRRIV